MTIDPKRSEFIKSLTGVASDRAFSAFAVLTTVSPFAEFGQVRRIVFSDEPAATTAVGQFLS